jgi:HlyD family secretion protein
VRKGDLLATLDLPLLDERLRQELIKLEQFSSRSDQMTELERSLAESERQYIQGQRDLIDSRIAEIEESAQRFKRMADALIEKQRASVVAGKEAAEELGRTLEERWDARAALAAEGLLAESQALEMRTRVIENRLKMAELEAKDHELDLRENNARESYDKQLDLIRDLRIDLHAFELREMLISGRLSADELTNTSERQAIERTIEELTAQLENESRITSEHDGVVLEIVAALGQQVAIGERLGKIEIEDESAELMALAYFSVKDGKRIEDGFKIRVAPSTVERERFGSIVGSVVSVSDYPVTIDAATNQIGDRYVARTLLGDESRIEVLAHLDVDDTFTKYKWTSGTGPESTPITAGTTAHVRVTIEEIAPYELILPFLRSVSGV